MRCEYGMCVPRSFPNKEERLAALKEYKEALDNESKGVTERIAELESED